MVIMLMTFPMALAMTPSLAVAATVFIGYRTAIIIWMQVAATTIYWLGLAITLFLVGKATMSYGEAAAIISSIPSPAMTGLSRKAATTPLLEALATIRSIRVITVLIGPRQK